jgi:2-isopropylmalate synthase
MFYAEYVRDTCWKFVSSDGHESEGKFSVKVVRGDVALELNEAGNGPLDSLVRSLKKADVPMFEVAEFIEHTLAASESALAIAYVQIRFLDGGGFWGAGVDSNVKVAAIKALLSALNRASVS